MKKKLIEVPICEDCIFLSESFDENGVPSPYLGVLYGFPCCLCVGLFDTDRSYFVKKVD